MGVLGVQVLQEKFFELCDFASEDLVQESSHSSVEDAHLLLSDERNILLLLQELGQLLSSV